MQTTQRNFMDLPLPRMMITEPGSFSWILGLKDVYGEMAIKKPKAWKLVERLDAKPMARPCSGNCGNPATRGSAYNSTMGVYCWCDTCNPYMAGADKGKLTLLHGYMDVLSYAGTYLNKSNTKKLIRHWAELKGLPERLGSVAEAKFFTDLMDE